MIQQRKQWLLMALAIAACLCVALGAGLSQIADDPGPLPTKHNVILPEGTGILAIGRLMKDEGVVGSRWLFPFYYILLEYHRPLKAGEYEFAAGASYRQVLATLGSGITVVRKLTIPEGITASQALMLLNENETLRGVVPAEIPEGSLLPETYYYSYGDDRAWLLSRMQKGIEDLILAHWDKRAKDLPFTSVNEALTLASIVEKETGVPSERGRVASVYINRLRQNMRLQADPTVIYGITQGKGALGRPITREDLTTDTPYNTYTRNGLPPTPIALPGRDSILAVLNPPETKDIFFVADGRGGHVFSQTLNEHNKNVTHYRAVLSGKESPKPEKPAEKAAPAAAPKPATEKPAPAPAANPAAAPAAKPESKPEAPAAKAPAPQAESDTAPSSSSGGKKDFSAPAPAKPANKGRPSSSGSDVNLDPFGIF